MTMKYIVFLSVLLFCSGLLANDTIQIEQGIYGIDYDKHLIVVNQDIGTVKDAVLIDNVVYSFVEAISAVQIGIAYTVTNESKDTYALYFTKLPLININTMHTIVDEPKVPAELILSERNSTQIRSEIGIEIRGGSTQRLPKKSYRIEFAEDVRLLGLRSDDDWDLQAMANQPLRFRSVTNFDIWRKISDINSSRLKYAELFINNEYKGIYGVAEPVDRKQLNLRKYDPTEKTIHGELYKGRGWGPNLYNSCPPYDNNSRTWYRINGHGFECDYPNEVNPDWQNLYYWVSLVVNGSDNDFYSQYKQHFSLQSAVDYYIFLNLLKIVDNTGNNLFVAKQDVNSPYFFVPWDLDGTTGIIWNGESVRIDDEPNTLLSNNLYLRLLKDYSETGFNATLKQKWIQIRNDWLNVFNLMDMYRENYDYLLQNGVYDRECLAWNDYIFDPSHLDFMTEWVANRLIFLDETFNNLKSNITDVQETKCYQNVDVRIYDMRGQLLNALHLNRFEENNLSSLGTFPAGIYIIQIRNLHLNKVRKIIVDPQK